MKRPAFQFYTGDWRKDPNLRRCSPATRGIWVDLLCDIHDLDHRGETRGTLEQLARSAGCFPAEMEAALRELSATETADVTFCHNEITVVSRRFLREWRIRNTANARQKKRRGADGQFVVTPDVTQNVTPYGVHASSSSSSSSSEQKHMPVEQGKEPTLVEVDPPPLDFEAVYKLYPRKEGKIAGLKRLRVDVRTHAALADFKTAVENYARITRDWPSDKRKHFSSFVSIWREYLDPEVLASARSAALDRHRATARNGTTARRQDDSRSQQPPNVLDVLGLRGTR